MMFAQKILTTTTLYLILLSAITLSVVGQNVSKQLTYQQLKKTSTDFLAVDKQIVISTNDFLKQPKQLLNLTAKDALIKQKTTLDKQGHTFQKLQQTYQGVPIVGTQLIVQEKEGKVQYVKDKLLRNFEVNCQPTLTEKNALSGALQQIKASTYAWQNPEYEHFLEATQQTCAKAAYPSGELVIISPNFLKTGNPKQADDCQLAYKFEIHTLQPFDFLEVYVNAHTGKVVTTLSKLYHTNQADQHCTGVGNYMCGKESLDFLAILKDGKYVLEEEGRNIVTVNGEQHRDASIFEINQNNYTQYSDPIQNDSPEWLNYPNAVDVHTHTEQVYDYYLTQHEHKGLDNQGSKIINIINLVENNAFWSENIAFYGRGNGTSLGAFTSLDVVAHELTHGITKYTADLIYSSGTESAILHESFSDMMAMAIKFKVQPECADWIIGKEIVLEENKEGLRNMANPKDATMRMQQPDTYRGTYWENGKPHKNNGVGNYWFYLLSEGGSGINDNGDSYEVAGLGIEKAANIVYYTLAHYLPSTANFMDARNSTLQTAINLYSHESVETEQVIKAWYAVGVGQEALSDVLNILSPSDPQVLEAGQDYKITWESLNNTPQISIDYSINNQDWINIDTVVNTQSGTYTWTIPELATKTARVRIMSTIDSTITDISNHAFTIESCGVLAGFIESESVVCRNRIVEFNNISSDNATAYTWFINNSIKAETEEFSYIFSQDGTYNIALKVSNGSECKDIYQTTIQVEGIPDNSFHYVTDDLQFFGFAPTAYGHTSYLWEFGDGQIDTVENPTYTYETFGDYEVCLTLADVCDTLRVCEHIFLENTSPDITFQKTFGGDKAEGIYAGISTSDNGYIVVGKTNSFSESYDVYVVKFNERGEEEWSKTYGGLKQDIGYKITATLEGNYIIVGETESFGNGDDDIYILKIDRSGNKLWSKIFGGTQNDKGQDIIVTEENEYIIVGKTESFNVPETATIILKLDTEGNKLWSKVYDNGDVLNSKTILKTNDNQYIIAGSSSKDAEKNLFVLKITETGEITFAKTYGTENDDFSSYQPLALTPDNGFLLSGVTEASDKDMLLIKLTTNGEEVWSQTIESVQGKSEGVYAVCALEDAYVLSGYYRVSPSDYDVPLLKLSLTGEIIWSKTYGSLNRETGSFLQETQDDGFIFGGSQAIKNKGYLIKTDHYGTSGCQEQNLNFTNKNISITTNDLILSTTTIHDNVVSITDELKAVTTIITNICTNPSLRFQKTMRIHMTDSIQLFNSLSDDGFIMGGKTKSGYNYGFLTQLDHNYNRVWSKIYRVSGIDLNKSIKTTNGNYFLGGQTSSNFNKKSILVKTDENGNVLWSKSFAATENLHLSSLVATIDDGVLMVGYRPNNEGELDVCLTKVTADGTIEWSKSYGGELKETPYKVIQTTDGGYLALMETQSFSINSSTANSKDLLLTKLTAIGNVEWSKVYGEAGDDEGNFLKEEPDGYMIVGTTNSFFNLHSIFDTYVVKVDFDGNVIWSKIYTADAENEINGVIDALDGNKILFGNIKNDAYLLKIDKEGNAIFSKKYGGDYKDAFQSAIVNQDGGYTLAGQTQGLPTGISLDIYLVKVNALGQSGNCYEESITTYTDKVTTRTATIALPVHDLAITIEEVSAESQSKNKDFETACEVNYSNTCNITASFTTSATKVCMEEFVAFTNQSQNATAYEWLVNGENSATSLSWTTQFQEVGTYIIQLIAKNDSCEDIHTEVIEVYPKVSQTPILETRQTCKTDSLVLSVEEGMADYRWTYKGATISTASTTIAYETGEYYLEMQDYCSNYRKDTIQVTITNDCVNPGDYNGDGQVNHKDVLAIGVAYGKTGPTCTRDYSTEQVCEDWPQFLPNGQNYKHIDGNRNGIIDDNDLLAIGQHYGKKYGIHTETASPYSDDNKMANSLKSDRVVTEKDTLVIQFSLEGNDSLQAYGLAFDFDLYLSQGVRAKVIDVSFDNAQFSGKNENRLTYFGLLPNEKLGVAWVRRDGKEDFTRGIRGDIYVEIENIPSHDEFIIEAIVDNASLIDNTGNLLPLGKSNTQPFAFIPEEAATKVNLKTFLEGAFDPATQKMRTDLLAEQLLPLTQPFTENPYDYNGTESVISYNDMPTNAVDWVLVEVRADDDPDRIVTQKAALLLADGNIVSVDGTRDELYLAGLENNESYHLVIRSRNHLDVISSLPILVNNQTINYDFTTDVNQALGNDQLKLLVSNTYGQLAGDITGEGLLTTPDVNKYKENAALLNTYHKADLNLDKNITTKDYNFYKINAGKIGNQYIKY